MASTALSGLRVLDLAGDAFAYCGKLFADLGADVIKIESPEGDPARAAPPFWGDVPGPDRSLRFLYLNTSKRGIALDLTQPGDRAAFQRLAQTADLVIEALPPGHLDAFGIGYAALARAAPRLVWTSIAGFGQTGPQRDWKSSDLVANALGGALYVTGEADDPPVALAGSQAGMMAASCAAASSLIALHHAARTGRGQSVDISMEEVTVAVTHICGAGKYLDDRIVPRRMGSGLFASVPSGAYPCRDGLVYLMINRSAHWQALARWIHEVTGEAGVLDPLFDGPSSSRQPYRDLIDVYITQLTTRFNVAEIYHEGQRRHIAFTPVHTAADVARDPHLAARGYFVEVAHPGLGALRLAGAPYRLADTPWAIRRPAPRLGEHNAEVLGEVGGEGARSAVLPSPLAGDGQDGGSAAPLFSILPHKGGGGFAGRAEALAGLRVVEFTAGMAGPWIGRFMAYCGAEVIKVESRQRPDVTRQYVPPWAPELGIQSQLSPWFTDWNAGKRFVALDLTKPEAVALAQRLVAVSDVVVENYAPGVIEKLGLGYAALRVVKPDLIMLSSSGYGGSGPYARYVTWGPNIEALSGLSTLSGFPDRPCTVTQYAYPDALSALHGFVAVLSALEHRRRTGRGQAIDLAQYETTASVIGDVLMEYLANGREPARRGNRSLTAAPHNCYRCRGDDRWCAIAVFSDDEWPRLCGVMERPELATDARFATSAARLAHVDELDRLIEAWTASCDAYDVMRAVQGAGVAAGVVQTVADQLERDAQLAARGFFEEIEHAVKGRVLATGIPLGLTATPGRTTGTGAAVGADNDYVFRELLGLSADEMQHALAIGSIEAAE
jgi:crotonobetainyl-CoA:carnitine CoA-transferase CaiB-like acyl-CoA transferase